MWDGAGPLRTGPQLEAARVEIAALQRETSDIALAPQRAFALNLQEKVELRIMLAVAESIVLPAIARRETRGAHVRLDFPESDATTVARYLDRADGAWTMHERALAAAS
jgi:succinate dehydrogenase / fumarate reductase flavoprotein subunit/fumarate reductase (CoM/CoB) subunit A